MALLKIAHAGPLVPGTLVGRRKRFFADVDLDDGTRVVAHCVNTGKMEGLLKPGARVWLSQAAPESKRKLRYTWELIELEGQLIGTNTLMANRIVRHVLEARVLPGLSRYSELRSEYRYGEGSRADFWLRSGKRQHYIEVKNCNLVYPDGAGYFPDARSERGERHLKELTEMVRAGHRATVIFSLQRADARKVRPSDVHDPGLAAAARAAAGAGVAFRAIRVRPSLRGYEVERELPVDLRPYPLEPVRHWRENAPRSGVLPDPMA